MYGFFSWFIMFVPSPLAAGLGAVSQNSLAVAENERPGAWRAGWRVSEHVEKGESPEDPIV